MWTSGEHRKVCKTFVNERIPVYYPVRDLLGFSLSVPLYTSTAVILVSRSYLPVIVCKKGFVVRLDVCVNRGKVFRKSICQPTLDNVRSPYVIVCEDVVASLLLVIIMLPEFSGVGKKIFFYLFFVFFISSFQFQLFLKVPTQIPKLFYLQCCACILHFSSCPFCFPQI